jgi:2-octaprenyl-6-methoxyphenol hydroxylase
MDHDVLIAGGGIAGLTAAAAFGAAGFSVLCVDPQPPVTQAADPASDLRTTAFLQPARAFLADIGLWDRLQPHATPLQVMRIVDAGGPDPEVRVSRDFDAADLQDDLPFGWNLPNWLLRREILAHLETLPTVSVCFGLSAKRLLTRSDEARVQLSDGTSRRCKLVIAADGRQSAMRQEAGIGVKTTRFGQKALAFAVTHAIPHENVSTEIHRTGGPFTLVPLPNRDGKPCSAVVWMEKGPEATRLAALPQAEFDDVINIRSCGVLGQLNVASRRTVWPIISQYAEALSAQRLALVAEAAHVVPPIGAQGLNMSLKDLITLRDLAVTHKHELGSTVMLRQYERARMVDVRMRVAGITALNHASMAQAPVLRDLRAQGLRTLYGIKPLRTALMRLGLGAN